MPAPEPSPVVIACPHCGTRYQVAYATIGSKGRNVQCAHCGESWQAQAERPEIDMVDEDLLDQSFTDEEVAQRTLRRPPPEADQPARSADYQRTLDEIKAAIAPKPGKPAAETFDPATHKRQQREFSKRQRSNHGKLPVVRIRRAARTGALVMLVALVAGGIALRGVLVQQYPQLAGLYAGVGLGVNVLGLEFRDVQTLKSLQHGDEVLAVDGRVANIASGPVPVPQIIVTLLGPGGRALYEWSVLPRTDQLRPGETVSFQTQLVKPPESAKDVKLSFASGRPASASDAAAAAPLQLSIEEPDNGQNSAR